MAIVDAVAIVGMGPRGLYCLERLVAEYNARPLQHALHIDLFNRSRHFGASLVYDPGQPEYILVNVSVGEVDLWTADDPPAAAGKGPGFVEWYRETFRPQTPLTGNEYLSRAVVGRYLVEGFHRILDHLPAGVTIACHVGEVTDIRPQGRSYRLAFVDDTGQAREIPADKILLATGHSRLLPGVDEQRYEAFASRHARASFIPFVYPVVESMARIPAGATVAMVGIGLTFIDAVLELTEGRGGRFERSAGGSLTYLPGGGEPQSIVAFSRTGLPMAPKAHDQSSEPQRLTFFTPGALADLRRHVSGGQLDLERDIWPLFEHEMELHYYRVTMGAGSEREQLESCGTDCEAMRRVIDAYRESHPGQEPFDYRQVLDPVGARRFESGAELAAYIERYMEEEIARARVGLAGCGVKAAVEIWYDVRTTLGAIVPFGGLTPESHRKLIEYYYPRLKRVAFGPPIINIEKLLALVRIGLLDFSVSRNPRVLTDDARGCFEIRCDEVPGASAYAGILIDARYPSTDIRCDATPLYSNLRRRGMVRPFENRLRGGGDSAYRPGAIDMTDGSRFVVDAGGTANEDITVIGIPTEGNLVGNLTVTRDEFSGAWAAEVMRQLR